jgi:hypothetical protein
VLNRGPVGVVKGGEKPIDTAGGSDTILLTSGTGLGGSFDSLLARS